MKRGYRYSDCLSAADLGPALHQRQHTALILTTEPVFAAITSFVVLHERLGARALVGAALILGGILLAELKGPVPPAEETHLGA